MWTILQFTLTGYRRARKKTTLFFFDDKKIAHMFTTNSLPILEKCEFSIGHSSFLIVSIKRKGHKVLFYTSSILCF